MLLPSGCFISEEHFFYGLPEAGVGMNLEWFAPPLAVPMKTHYSFISLDLASRPEISKRREKTLTNLRFPRGSLFSSSENGGEGKEEEGEVEGGGYGVAVQIQGPDGSSLPGLSYYSRDGKVVKGNRIPARWVGGATIVFRTLRCGNPRDPVVADVRVSNRPQARGIPSGVASMVEEVRRFLLMLALQTTLLPRGL